MRAHRPTLFGGILRLVQRVVDRTMQSIIVLGV